MGGSVILTHSGSKMLVRVRLLLDRLIRLAGGLLLAKDEMVRDSRKNERRTAGRRMVYWRDGLGQGKYRGSARARTV